MIEIQGLTKSVQTETHRVDILRGIDLSIPRGQFAAIMGASGSGKSTLLGLMAGLDSPTTGRIQLDGEEITTLNEDQLARLRGRKVGFVFQSYQLIPTLTAEENVLLPFELTGGAGLDAAGETSGHTQAATESRHRAGDRRWRIAKIWRAIRCREANIGRISFPLHDEGSSDGAKRSRGRPERDEASLGSGRRRAAALLEAVGLSDRGEHYPVQLSGGEQQRVALARAFMVRPPILFADEPTGNLDSVNGQHVLELLLALNEREGATLVLVTHDPMLARHANRILRMQDGVIVADEAA